ncbi:MAG: hypothetical protein GC202_02160 [Alphaproteobacteria bacterium]|nr:hypothetical protein [Alphaproteobacteria bacterium]
MNAPALDVIAQPAQGVDVTAQRGEARVVDPSAELRALQAQLDDGVAAGLWHRRLQGDFVVYTSASFAHDGTLSAVADAIHSTQPEVLECVR